MTVLLSATVQIHCLAFMRPRSLLVRRSMLLVRQNMSPQRSFAGGLKPALHLRREGTTIDSSS